MSRITFNQSELSQDIILNKIEKEIDKMKVKISDEDRKLVIAHSYAQIEIIIDKLTSNKNSLYRAVTLPVYNVDENNYIIFNDIILKKSKVKYKKESILNFINELCVGAIRYAVKGL